MNREKLLMILYWITFILAIILFFWFFFGHSPTFETVVTTIFAGFLFHLYHRVDDVNKRLTRVEVEIDSVKESLGRIESTLQKKRKL